MNFYLLNHLFPHSNGLRIVYYHLVAPEKKSYHFDSINIENFREQINFFNKRYKIISLVEALERFNMGKNLNNYLSITTDDGFSENYDYLAPILEESNLKATFFLIGNCINNKNLMWRNKLIYMFNNDKSKLYSNIPMIIKKFSLEIPRKKDNVFTWSIRWPMTQKENIIDFLWANSNLELLDHFLEREKPYLSIHQIQELLSKGFEIGNHTFSHPDCSRLNSQELLEELQSTSRILNETFGVDSNIVSYPFSDRPNLNIENKVNKTTKSKVLLGVGNKLSNNITPLSWERDRQEFKTLTESWFRFSVVPIYRKIVI